jgi:serine/threonine protein kinase
MLELHPTDKNKLRPIRSEERTGTDSDNPSYEEVKKLEKKAYEPVGQAVLDVLGLQNHTFEFIKDSRFNPNVELICITDHQDESKSYYVVKLFVVNKDDGVKTKWLREAAACEKLNTSEHFVHIYGSSLTKNGKYGIIVMDYFNGIDLAAWYKFQKDTEGHIPYRKVVDLAKKILHAVQACHDHQLAHGDLSTRNILVSTHQTSSEYPLKLIDFGNSPQVTQEVKALKSGIYYPYERVKVWQDGFSDDVFTLGVVLQTMFSKGDSLIYMARKPTGEVEEINLSERKPNKHALYKELAEKFMEGYYTHVKLLPIKVENLISPEITANQLQELNLLIADMTNSDPKARPPIGAVVERLIAIFPE